MRVLSVRVVVSIGLLVLFVAGCQAKKIVKTKGEQISGERPAENVVALVGDEAITKAEVEALLERIPENRREKYRERAVSRLIEDRVFSQEAGKAGLDEDPEVNLELESEINTILTRYFLKMRLDPQCEPSQEDVEQYYQEHEDEFVVPDGVFVQHILVRRKMQAEEMLKALKEGASFDKLARQKNIDRSWNESGRLGWLFKGRMDPTVEKVAFDLQKGEFSDVIQTDKGFEIIKVLDKGEKTKIGFAEAQAGIRRGLYRKKKTELIHQYYKEANVDMDPSEKGVLVKVGDKAFTEEDLAPILARISERKNEKETRKEKEKVRKRWIDHFVETTVFSTEARAAGLENVPNIAAELKVKRAEVLAKAFKKTVLEKPGVDDKEVADYYESHPEKFKTPVSARVRTILVKTREEAEEIVREINSGAAFSTLALQKSIDPSAPRGGELGWFHQGQKDPELERAAFSMKKMEISGIIKTEAGYQIIRLMDKRGGDVKPLEIVSGAIRMELLGHRIKREKERYYNKAGVKVFGY